MERPLICEKGRSEREKRREMSVIWKERERVGMERREERSGVDVMGTGLGEKDI